MTQINIKLEDNVKKKAEEILDELGFSMSGAINVFLKTVIRERRIPFSLELDSVVPDSINLDLMSDEEKIAFFKKMIEEDNDPNTKYVDFDEMRKMAKRGEWDYSKLESKTLSEWNSKK